LWADRFDEENFVPIKEIRPVTEELCVQLSCELIAIYGRQAHVLNNDASAAVLRRKDDTQEDLLILHEQLLVK
jgi:hypothetical protein